ncbi:MAG TPA: hypothetical protein VF503_08690 [Sphingobium sp.]|uniref:hypothetical protein n=1 Tax=Sphingobium sp. TaxID=1912891 RepID=UPI002ED0CE7B
MAFALLAVGFTLGVSLSALIACQVFGCLHAEAVTIVDAGCLCGMSLRAIGATDRPYGPTEQGI